MDRFAAAALTLYDEYANVIIRPATATAGDPIACRRWDVGAPDVRITSTPMSGADGTVETGGYLGSRTATFELLIRGDSWKATDGHDPYWYVDVLTAMCHPVRKPRLRIERASEPAGGVGWELALRGNPWSLEYTRASAAMIELTLSFTAPLGVFESDVHTLASSGLSTAAATDWHFPAAFPHGFGAVTGSPFLTATVGGSAPIYPTIYLSGPMTNPEIHDDAGRRFKFTGLTIPSGRTVQINMTAGTVLLADPATGVTNPDSDVFHTVDFAVSDFWQWFPGTHTVGLKSTGGSFALQWRDRQTTV